jgi:hypothetical protein
LMMRDSLHQRVGDQTQWFGTARTVIILRHNNLGV